MVAQSSKLSVLLKRDEAQRFDDYCKEKGFKKSSLIARLIREYLNHEGYRTPEGPLPEHPKRRSTRR